MDKAVALYATSNVGVFKEPRGVIRIIQFILAIFAFATTCGFSGKTAFSVKCSETESKDFQLIFSYPFDINSQNKIDLKGICWGNGTGFASPYGSYKGPSEFYVFVGVICFLYCIGSVILYVLFDEVYRKMEMIPMADFIATAVLTFFWFLSSCIWAQGLTDLKTYTNPLEFYGLHIPECAPNALTCQVKNSGNYAGLNVSIIFGFLNAFVWGSSLWFLFKETQWFKVRSKPADVPAEHESEPQRV